MFEQLRYNQIIELPWRFEKLFQAKARLRKSKKKMIRQCKNIIIAKILQAIEDVLQVQYNVPDLYIGEGER